MEVKRERERESDIKASLSLASFGASYLLVLLNVAFVIPLSPREQMDPLQRGSGLSKEWCGWVGYVRAGMGMGMGMRFLYRLLRLGKEGGGRVEEYLMRRVEYSFVG